MDQNSVGGQQYAEHDGDDSLDLDFDLEYQDGFVEASLSASVSFAGGTESGETLPEQSGLGIGDPTAAVAGDITYEDLAQAQSDLAVQSCIQDYGEQRLDAMESWSV